MKQKIGYTILILIILVTPFIYSNNLYNGVISAKQIWFLGAMALLILVFSLDVLFRKETIRITLNNIDIALLVFCIYLFIRALFTPYTPVLSNARFLNYSLLLLFYFFVKYAYLGMSHTRNNSSHISGDAVEKNEVASSMEILVIVLMLTGLVQAIWGLLQIYGMTQSFHSIFRITGTFFNPAPYAIYLAVIFPLALGKLLLINELSSKRINGITPFSKPMSFSQILRFPKTSVYAFLDSLTPSLVINKLTYYISLITVISIILVLPATMNRTSWIGVVVGSLVVFNSRYSILKMVKEFLKSATRKLVFFVILIILVGSSIAGLYYLKKGSSDGRLLIWEVTLGKIAEKPLFGYGVGRFEAEYNNWQSDYFRSHPEEIEGPKGLVAGNTKYCFNEYLEMASELGIFGLLLFLGIIVTVFIQINRNNKKELSNENNINKFLVLNSFKIFIPSLLSLLICTLISFPFYSLPTLILFFLLIAFLSSNMERNHKSEKIISSLINNNFTKTTIFLFFSTVSILLIVTLNKQVKARITWNEVMVLFKLQDYDASGSLSEIYSPLLYTGAYLQQYGIALYLNEDYLRGQKMLELSKHYISNQPLYTTLGETYKILKKYSKAEEAYTHSIFMVPHKLYPRYMLAKFYFETGQKEKSLIFAEEILKKNLKIESTAASEIKKEMVELIEELKHE
jgi:O-antigen ligase